MAYKPEAEFLSGNILSIKVTPLKQFHVKNLCMSHSLWWTNNCDLRSDITWTSKKAVVWKCFQFGLLSHLVLLFLVLLFLNQAASLKDKWGLGYKPSYNRSKSISAAAGRPPLKRMDRQRWKKKTRARSIHFSFYLIIKEITLLKSAACCVYLKQTRPSNFCLTSLLFFLHNIPHHPVLHTNWNVVWRRESAYLICL